MALLDTVNQKTEGTSLILTSLSVHRRLGVRLDESHRQRYEDTHRRGCALGAYRHTTPHAAWRQTYALCFTTLQWAMRMESCWASEIWSDGRKWKDVWKQSNHASKRNVALLVKDAVSLFLAALITPVKLWRASLGKASNQFVRKGWKHLKLINKTAWCSIFQ